MFMHVVILYFIYIAHLVCCALCRPQFGTVFDLTTSKFVDCIDKEQPAVFVIVHIYEKVRGCAQHIDDESKSQNT